MSSTHQKECTSSAPTLPANRTRHASALCKHGRVRTHLVAVSKQPHACGDGRRVLVHRVEQSVERISRHDRIEARAVRLKDRAVGDDIPLEDRVARIADDAEERHVHFRRRIKGGVDRDGPTDRRVSWGRAHEAAVLPRPRAPQQRHREPSRQARPFPRSARHGATKRVRDGAIRVGQRCTRHGSVELPSRPARGDGVQALRARITQPPPHLPTHPSYVMLSQRSGAAGFPAVLVLP